jgi:hypothetical protein
VRLTMTILSQVDHQRFLILSSPLTAAFFLESF